MSVRRPLTLLLALAGALLAVAPADGTAGGPARSAADRPDPGPARAGASLDASALDATAGVELKQLRKLSRRLLRPQAAEAPRRGRGAGDHRQARGAWRRHLGRARRAHAAAVGADRPELEPAVGHVRPSSGNYGIDLPGARDITTRLAGHHDRRDRHGLPARTSTSPAASSPATTSSATLSSRTTATDATPTRSTRATGSRAPRTRAGTSPAAGRATARGTAPTCRARSAPSSDNGIGVAGINQVSKIQPLRVLGKCGGYTSDIADAIRWAAGLHRDRRSRQQPDAGPGRQHQPRRQRRLRLDSRRTRSTPQSPRARSSSSPPATATRTRRTSPRPTATT